MKKKIFTRFYMLAMLILFATSPLQAQSWTTYDELTMHNDMKTDVQYQKVRQYRYKFPISVGNQLGGNQFFFTKWEGVNNTVEQFFLNDTNIIVSDFTILGDTLYFCGKRLNIQTNNYEGIIGRVGVYGCFYNQNTNYEVVNIVTTKDLTKIVAYYLDEYRVNVVAIGDNGLSTTLPGRVIQLNIDINSPSLNYSTLNCAYISNTQKEIMHDICLLEDKIATVSRIYPDDRYIVRYYSLDNNLTNTFSCLYNFQNITFNTTSYAYDYPLHISEITKDVIAVGVSAMSGLFNFTMLNLLLKDTTIVLPSHFVMHENKDNKLLEMEYSTYQKKLLMLHSNFFESHGTQQTLCFIDLNEDSTYIAFLNYLTMQNQLNHFSIISNDKYAVAGAYNYYLSYPQQLLATSTMEEYPYSCSAYEKTPVFISNLTTGTSFPNLTTPYYLNLNWSTTQGHFYNSYLYIDCHD